MLPPFDRHPLPSPPLLSLTMFPSKAERILSRYRPIAPKPLPLPPPSGSFGTTDPSSTCASLDSFTSSTKCRRSRKRKGEASSSVRVLKATGTLRSGPYSNGETSSITQSVSIGIAAPGDARSASNLALGSSSSVHGRGEEVETLHDTRRESWEISEAKVPACGAMGVLGAPLFDVEGGNMSHHQGPLGIAATSIYTRLNPKDDVCGCGRMEKDMWFMEGAAPMSAKVSPDRSISLTVCDPVRMEGVGHVAGGFTEMLRGITRLPTAADVQSLMQARASSSPGSVQTTGCDVTRNLPMRGRDKQPGRSEQLSVCSSLPLKVSSLAQNGQEWESKSEMVTLPLLPNEPVKAASSPTPSDKASSSLAKPHMQVPCQGLRNVHKSCGLETPADLSSVFLASGHSTGALMVPGIPLFSSGAGEESTSVQSLSSGAKVDAVYLEQVYGRSTTDPVLLVDDCNQPLWFNKTYDQAMKSAAERMSGKIAPGGAYIDPLGHPFRLASFVLPVHGGLPTRARTATLWGFLKKLVMQEHDSPLEHGQPGGPSGSATPSDPSLSSQPCVRDGQVFQKWSPTRANPTGREREGPYAGHPWPIRVTLEHITELHMEAPMAAESVEAAEARLRVGAEPALIIDHLNRVRWVNDALKQMVGQVQVEGHAQTSNTSGACPCSGAPAIVIQFTERVPCSAWAFSGSLNMEWMRGCRRRSMTVPCDMHRLACSSRSPDIHWVWKFDMAVSLCLSSPCC